MLIEGLGLLAESVASSFKTIRGGALSAWIFNEKTAHTLYMGKNDSVEHSDSLGEGDVDFKADINIPLEKVCYIILRAREFDVKVAPTETDPPSTSSDIQEHTILEDYADDPTYEELKGAIDELNEDEKIDLIVLAWIGRGDYGGPDLDEARGLARERNHDASRYLTGIPLLGDFLEEGLSELGYSCEDSEVGRL